jgi:hypothetical protein
VEVDGEEFHKLDYHTDYGNLSDKTSTASRRLICSVHFNVNMEKTRNMSAATAQRTPPRHPHPLEIHGAPMHKRTKMLPTG